MAGWPRAPSPPGKANSFDRKPNPGDPSRIERGLHSASEFSDGNMDQVILYFGNDWEAENRTSSHHVARWLAKRYRVYYLEAPGLRAPPGSGRDVRKLFSKVWKLLRGPRQVPEGLRVRTLFQIPFH